MSPTGIQSLCLSWPASQVQLVRVPITLADGHTIASWASFVLTIREDPDYPRSGADLYDPLNPVGSWDAVVESAGTAYGSDEVRFSVTVPADPGIQRYALDVWGIGGTAGDACFIPATWLTVTPNVS